MVAFYRRKQNTVCGVIVEIGSGSVAASIVLSRQGKPLPEIVYTRRKSTPLRGGDTSADHLRAIRRVLFSVMLDLERDGMKVLHKKEAHLRIQQMLVSSGAPWSHTASQVIHFHQAVPFTVTHRMVDEMIAHAYEKEQEAEAKEKVHLEMRGYHLVEKAVIDIALNGYSVADPYDKQASEITITHVRGLVANSIARALEDIKKHLLADTPTRIHTAMLVAYCVLRDLYPKTKSALILSINEEATEAGLMQNGILYESVAADEGINSVIREIAAACKTLPEEARGYLHAYKQGALKAAQEKALARGQQRYAGVLRALCAELRKRSALAQTVFLITDPSTEAFFADALTEATRAAGERREWTIIPVFPEVAGATDPQTALSARFFHKLHACGEINN